MTHTFARMGAAFKMRVADVSTQGWRTCVRLHENGGKRHEIPCDHTLDEALHRYIAGARLKADPKGWLFRTALGRSRLLSEQPMGQADV